MGTVTRDRTTPESHRSVAIWGGVECTVNRVGDTYFDQLERNGHAFRPDDLRRFAELGLRTLRFPLLWERIAPEGVENARWEWADERMELMRELGIRPIVGLVHHGSGPRTTSLLDPQFPEKLAAYARAVAERYPWANCYTPVNEPLTTARFSALYGVWYPHARNDRSFVQALLNECQATALAMRAIREVNPDALLLQTEDLGKSHSAPRLRYQARFENHRRWISFDLLRGDVDERHPLWKYLRYHLQEGDRLEWMRDNPTPPDILGLNYYVTSERFLDDRLERYPGCAIGGNRRHRYVDTEAVRVLADGIDGPERMLREVWDRYHLPMAVTEAHLGCARVEQMRWFDEIYGAAQRLKDDGVDIRAVTAWALLGTYDWHCLVTRCEGFYEPGVFDVRSDAPRPTALARMIRETIANGRFEHPLLDVPGWWRRPDRLLYQPVESERPGAERARAKRAAAGRTECLPADSSPDESVERTNGIDDPTLRHTNGNGTAHAIDERAVELFQDLANRHGHANGHAHVNGTLNGDGTPHYRPLLITGATGTLGTAFARVCTLRGIPYRLVTRAEMEIADAASVDAVLDATRPWAVVNTAGYVRVDDAELEEERCGRDNTDGPATLARACAARSLPLVTYSSDLVFDGRADAPYVESSETAPLNAYGRSKERAERQVLALHPGALVIRTSAFFGPWDEHNFVTVTLRSLEAGRPVIAADDMAVSPTYVPDLVEESLNLLIDGASGIWHLASVGAITWADLARAVAASAGHDPRSVIGRPTDELGMRAPRPRYTPLASERGVLLPTLEHALARYFSERRAYSNHSAVASARVVQTEA
jgi:dTDP-4-dehydrorhamnose reductase